MYLLLIVIDNHYRLIHINLNFSICQQKYEIEHLLGRCRICAAIYGKMEYMI